MGNMEMRAKLSFAQKGYGNIVITGRNAREYPSFYFLRGVVIFELWHISHFLFHRMLPDFPEAPLNW